MRRVLLFAFCALFAQFAMAQKTVTGTVSSDEGPLEGVTVLAKGTTIGGFTDSRGQFSLEVPNAVEVLVFSYIGYKEESVDLAGKNNVSVNMTQESILDEVVITGVSQGRSTTKVGFAVSRVTDDLITQVPAVDASQTLRGKVAGIQVIQGFGDQPAAVFLRGAKSVFGNISPLILVDGIITNQGLGDINAEDIESVEVIKGAAASSLYGSLAAGGVIQIVTKRGTSGKRGVEVVIDNEYGISDIALDYPTTLLHPYKLNPDGSFDLSSGAREFDTEADGTVKFDNAYPQYYDNINNLLSNQPFYNNYFSVAGREDAVSFFGSFQNQFRGGVATNELFNPDERQNARLNFTLTPNKKLTARVNASYTRITRSQLSPNGPEGRSGQGQFFSDVLVTEPFINLQERDADGDYAVFPEGFAIQNANVANPNYYFDKMQFELLDERFVAGIDINYELFKNFNIILKQTIDKNFYKRLTYFPVGFKTASPNPSLNQGNLANSRYDNTYNTSSVQANYGFNLGDALKIDLVGKYLYEFGYYEATAAQGEQMRFAGVINLETSDPDQTRNISSEIQERVTKNAFGNVTIDFKDKVIFDGMIRQDGSSLFGEDARWNTFGRAALAYRLTQDVTIPGVNELKLRAAYGTAGKRPRWNGQYETFTSGGSPGALGNKNLKPAVTTELEIGIDAFLWNRLRFQFNYANASTVNDFIDRPLSLAFGFTRQYVNIGEVKSNSFEFELGGEVFKSRLFSWDANLTWGRIRSEITDLGDIPPFTSGISRIETGNPSGTMFGAKFLTSLDELQTDENGFVINLPDFGADGYVPGDFSVNNAGYVVLTSTIGQADEVAARFKDEKTGDKAIIGDSNPDFLVGFSNTLTLFKDLQLYFLFDWKQGGDKYNGTAQYMYFNMRHQDQEMFSELGHHPNFAVGATSLYNGNAFSSHFVEDASYLKLREVTLSYTLRANKIGLDRVFDSIRFAIIGRNVLTFTNYTGWDPEGVIEDFTYPIYRTFSGKLTLRF